MKNDTIVEQLGGGNVIVADWKDPSSAFPHTHETVPCIFSKYLYHICDLWKTVKIQKVDLGELSEFFSAKLGILS